MSSSQRPGLGGLIHTYQRYDPKTFPSPTAPPPDVASAAFEHMLRYGSTRRLTEEELANAVHIDPSQIAGLGPSLDSLIRMLEERKRRILETYETSNAMREAEKGVAEQAAASRPPEHLQSKFAKAVRERQLRDLERLWYKLPDEQSPFAVDLLHLRDRLGELYQVEQLDADYDFTGREAMDVPKALEVKEELEAIDRLLEQLREAMENAQVAVIDMEELSRFAEEADIDQLRELREQVEQYMREHAELQGLESSAEGFKLTPQAYKIFQSKVLKEIFGELQAARSGRHLDSIGGPIEGEGAVELPKTKAYEFGDSVTHMDVGQSFVNALIREGTEARRHGGTKGGEEAERRRDEETKWKGDTEGRRGRVRLRAEDIEIHRTRNSPKCATAVLMDMSGSMRYEGQYVTTKRMAIALDGLIRTEYPGDFLAMFEMATFAKRVHISEVPGLLPKPVTIREPVVRLTADMSDPRMNEYVIPPHFTNIQHGLRLARQVLAAQDTPNRQIVVLTDGLPTAHFEGEHLYLLYPADPATEEATMREAEACRKEGITINLFLLPSWWQSSEDIAFGHELAERTGGRVFFTAGGDVDRFVLWDYVGRRRKIIG